MFLSPIAEPRAAADARGEIILMMAAPPPTAHLAPALTYTNATTAAAAAAATATPANNHREEGGGVSALPPYADPCYDYRHLPGLTPSSSTSAAAAHHSGYGGGGGEHSFYDARRLNPSSSSGYDPMISLPAKIAAALILLMLLLCLTTTTALVAVHHLDTIQMQAKLDLILSKLPDTPSLISTVRGDIIEVQAQGMMLLQAAEMQDARTEQLFDVFRMLVHTLQDYFNGGGGGDDNNTATNSTHNNNNNNNNNNSTRKKKTHVDVVVGRSLFHASPEWPRNVNSTALLPSSASTLTVSPS